MRLRILAIVFSACLLATIGASEEATAQQIPHRAECSKLTRQMARYARDAGWAAQRDNEMWEKASMNQYMRLAERRHRLCPHLRPKNYAKEFAKFLQKAAKVAAKLAIKYFTGGMDSFLPWKPF